MVKYNSRSLEAISDALHIVEVLVSAPDVNNTTIQPALRHGDIFARQRYGTRKVTITFVVMEDDEAARRQIIREVCSWARSTEPQKLELPQEPNGYLMAVCSGLPDNNAREYWNTLTLSFLADDPFFYANTESNQAIPLNGFAGIWLLQYDGADWRLEQTISGGLTAPMWRIGDTQISFSALPAGQLVIRRDKQSADIDGESVLPAMMLGSRFFDLKTGANMIETSGGAGGMLYWRERWI